MNRAAHWVRHIQTLLSEGITGGRWHAFCAVIMAGTAVVDVYTPLGLADGAGYLVAVVVAGMAPVHRFPYIVAAISTGLILLGGYWSQSGGISWIGVTSRAISIGAIWLIAWVVLQWRTAARSRAHDLSVRLRSILTHSHTNIFVKDLQGRYLEVNEQFLLLTGYSAAAVIGKTDLDLFPPETAALYREHDTQVIEAGAPMDFEETWALNDGPHLYMVSKFPLRDEHGAIVAIGGIATDITARLQAEAARSEAQERFDLVATATQTGIWDWDLLTDHMYYCPLWKASLGYQEHEVSNSPTEWESRLHPDDKGRAFALVDDYLSGRIPSYELEHRLRHRDGSYRWIRTCALLQRDAEGRPRRMIGSHVDITERKRAEDALAQSESTLRSFFNSGAMMMGIVELLDGDILHVSDNRRAASFFGTTPESMQGRRASKLGAPTDIIAHWIRYYEETERTKQPVRFEYVHSQRGSGVELCLSATVCWIGTGPSGRSRYSYVVDDVTEARCLAEALGQTAERYHGVVTALAEGVLLHDEQGRIVACNPSAEQILGLTADQLMGRTPVDPGWQAIHEDGSHFAPDQRPPVVTLRTGRPCSNVIMGLSRPTGERRWISINTQALRRSGEERPYAVVGSFHDITERRLAEQTLLEVQDKLEQRVRERTTRIHELESQRSQAEKLAALGHLAADIAHEVNNPLAGITNAFHLVKQGIGIDHRHYRFVELIDREIQRLAIIVKKMYSLYQGVPATEPQATNIDELLQDVATLLGHKLTSKRLRLRTDVVTRRQVVDAPRSDLFQVLLNLVQNAIDASPADSEVGLSVAERDGQLRWSVTDRGTGIATDILPRIFEPFFTTKSGAGWQGLGLGLSVSRGLVHAMGGRIEVETQPEHGSTFTVVHPLGRPSPGDGVCAPSAERKEQKDDDYAATHTHC
jgi:PAS domain S-box-containing protein